MPLSNSSTMSRSFGTSHFAASNGRIHDVIEAWVWPPALFPMGNELAVSKEIYWGLDGKTNGSECKLEIELTYPQLRREFPDYRRQVKLVWYPVHSSHSNGRDDRAAHAASALSLMHSFAQLQSIRSSAASPMEDDIRASNLDIIVVQETIHN